MKHLLIAVVAAALFAFAATGAFAAPNPSGHGMPSQTCLSGTSTALEPGNAASSPGSPFNETLPGTGGTHYTETSQYDVACFQVTQSH